MNTATLTTSAITQDPLSKGFTVFENSELTMKKLMRRTNTKANTASYTEPYQIPHVLPEQVMTDTIPSSPPTDFDTTLTGPQILSQFNIADVSQYATTLNGQNLFSIQQSTAYPHIYKINYCKLKPYISNPDLTFTAINPSSGVNLLQSTIPFEYANGAWKGTIYRTTRSGEVSRGGTDVIKETQLSYIFDYDPGFFVAYEKDVARYGSSPISSATPPSVTCYVYKGSFGNFSSLWQLKSDGKTIYYEAGPVLIGTSNLTNPNNTLEVGGDSLFNNIMANCITTLSDVRLKENIVLKEPTLELLNIRPYTYNFKTTPELKDFGVLAQEVEAIVPELVKDQDGVKSVRYDRFGVLLIPVVKQLSGRVEVVEKENADLKRRLERLEELILKVE